MWFEISTYLLSHFFYSMNIMYILTRVYTVDVERIAM